MKPVIIAIVGASGSGKTHMAEFLKSKLNIPVIVSYTTRPIRSTETEGVEHHFVDISKFPDKSDILAYGVFGKHKYCALHSQVPESGICTYVVDEGGLEEMTKRFSDRYIVVAVNVKSSEESLIRRGIDTERMERDLGRRLLRPEFYDSIIENDGTVEEFEAKILNVINN